MEKKSETKMESKRGWKSSSERGERIITKQVVELNVRTGQKKEIDARKMAENAIQEKVKEAYGEVGLKVNVEEIEDGEKFVSNYYDNLGFQVAKIDPPQGHRGRGRINDNIPENLRKDIKQDAGEDLYSLVQLGVPDFLVYKMDEAEVKDYFFVEAKHREDGLRPYQMKWIFHDNPELPVKVCFTAPKSKMFD